MNSKLLSRICDSVGVLNTYIRVVPRGGYYSAITLCEALAQAAPEVEWQEAGNAYEEWCIGDVPEGMNPTDIVDRITAYFKASGTWDEIEDPEVVDPEQDM